MSPNISESLGFDPAQLQENPEMASQVVADSRGQNSGPSQEQVVAQTGVDAAKDGAKVVKRINTGDELVKGAVDAQGKVFGAEADVAKGAIDLGGKAMSSEMDVAGDAAKTVADVGGKALSTEGKVLGTEAKVAGSVASEGASIAGKGLTALGDFAKSPVGKIAGKAALPLAVAGGAISMAQDAGTFGDAITDPFNSEKRDKAVKALREDSPIPGTPLVLDAITDPGKIADTAKDVGKVFTHPGMDSLKDAGKSIADELGF